MHFASFIPQPHTTQQATQHSECRHAASAARFAQQCSANPRDILQESAPALLSAAVSVPALNSSAAYSFEYPKP
jgi:hypothetical protein